MTYPSQQVPIGPGVFRGLNLSGLTNFGPGSSWQFIPAMPATHTLVSGVRPVVSPPEQNALATFTLDQVYIPFAVLLLFAATPADSISVAARGIAGGDVKFTYQQSLTPLFDTFAQASQAPMAAAAGVVDVSPGVLFNGNNNLEVRFTIGGNFYGTVTQIHLGTACEPSAAGWTNYPGPGVDFAANYPLVTAPAFATFTPR